MVIVNYFHPLTETHRAQIEALTGQPIDRLIDVPVQLDDARPFAAQAGELADAAGLSPTEWQTEPVLIVPPGLNFATAALLAELHGRTGHFLPVVRIRPVPGSPVPAYEVAEVINLQGLRDEARTRRSEMG